MKSKRFLLLVMAICLASGVKAQSLVYNSDVLFFHFFEDTRDGQMPSLSSPEARIFIIRIKDGALYTLASGHSAWEKAKEVSDNLKSNPNYYNTKTPKLLLMDAKDYDLDLSNVKWIVYKNPRYSSDDYDSFYAVKRDFSEFMRWREPDICSQDDRTPFGRSIGKRISKDQLIKMNYIGKRDFLND